MHHIYHKQSDHSDPAHAESCYVCKSELAQCTVCGAAEGELTTDCPERKMTNPELSLAYSETLDYFNGYWYHYGTSEQGRRAKREHYKIRQETNRQLSTGN